MSRTAPSTPRLSEVARHVVIPDGIVTTAWPRVVAKCSELGVDFDAWQHGVGSIALGKRADGKYAATVGGVVLSIPRQVGKTFLVGMIVIALCLLFPGMTILWTAHRTRTATKTFGTLKGMSSRKKIRPHMLEPRNVNGEQEIRFRNGSVIMFGAREQGFGRGFDEVDVEVFDEGQILTEKALEDMVAATNQSRQESGALLFFMGTPPRPSDPGEEWLNRRKKALSGKSSDMVYVEFSADADLDPDNPADFEQGNRQANPSYPKRTPIESLRRMKENLTDVASFRREAWGIYDDDGRTSEISANEWGALRLTGPAPDEGRRVFGVKFSVDGAWVALAGALRPEEGPVHVEGIRVESMAGGTGWLVDWLEDRWRESANIVIDGKAGAGALVNALRARKVPAKVIITPTTDQVIAAHTSLREAVRTNALTHADQKALNDQVAAAEKRPIGTAGGWGWKPIHETDDVTLLEAVTFAHWGALTTKRRPGREAVLL